MALSLCRSRVTRTHDRTALHNRRHQHQQLPSWDQQKPAKTSQNQLKYFLLGLETLESVATDNSLCVMVSELVFLSASIHGNLPSLRVK